MEILRSVFGPSKEEIWSKIAHEIGGEFVKDGFYKSGGIRFQHAQWPIVLDTKTVSDDKTNREFTRMRAPFINKDGLYFKLYRKSLFSGIGRFFGMEDIEIGDEYFDEQFIIKGNDEPKIRMMLADPQLKELIDKQPKVTLEIRDDEGFFGTQFPEGVDELVFTASGVIRDKQQLRDLFVLFAVLLERLVRIDSAYEDDPGVRLSF